MDNKGILFACLLHSCSVGNWGQRTRYWSDRSLRASKSVLSYWQEVRRSGRVGQNSVSIWKIPYEINHRRLYERSCGEKDLSQLLTHRMDKCEIQSSNYCFAKECPVCECTACTRWSICRKLCEFTGKRSVKEQFFQKNTSIEHLLEVQISAINRRNKLL